MLFCFYYIFLVVYSCSCWATPFMLIFFVFNVHFLLCYMIFYCFCNFFITWHKMCAFYNNVGRNPWNFTLFYDDILVFGCFWYLHVHLLNYEVYNDWIDIFLKMNTCVNHLSLAWCFFYLSWWFLNIIAVFIAYYFIFVIYHMSSLCRSVEGDSGYNIKKHVVKEVWVFTRNADWGKLVPRLRECISIWLRRHEVLVSSEWQRTWNCLVTIKVIKYSNERQIFLCLLLIYYKHNFILTKIRTIE